MFAVFISGHGDLATWSAISDITRWSRHAEAVIEVAVNEDFDFDTGHQSTAVVSGGPSAFPEST